MAAGPLRHPRRGTAPKAAQGQRKAPLSNRKAVLHIYHSVNRDIYEQYQWRVCTYVVRTYVDGVLGNRKMTSEDYTTVVDYLKCVSFGMIMGWLETGMNPNAMARFRRILELKCGDLEHLIDRCEKMRS